MITFFKLGEQGRLGNQLFQYAALKSLGLKRKYEVKIPKLKDRCWHGQKCLLSSFRLECEMLEENDISQLKFQYDNPPMEFDPNFLNIPDNTNLDGFFQNTYYFNEFDAEIKKELIPKQNYIDEALKILNNIKSEYKCEIISIHVRRGDILEYGNELMYKNMYKPDELPHSTKSYFSYLNKAKLFFLNKNVKYLIFVGGARNECGIDITDMEWCKKTFIGKEYLFSEPHDPVLDFSIIMNCDHNILSLASSYGWWAAYMNPNDNKIVVAPKYYNYNNTDYSKIKGFYPKTWVII